MNVKRTHVAEKRFNLFNGAPSNKRNKIFSNYICIFYILYNQSYTRFSAAESLKTKNIMMKNFKNLQKSKIVIEKKFPGWFGHKTSDPIVFFLTGYEKSAQTDLKKRK